MSFEPLAVVILAAGLGKRMKSNIPKVLHKAMGKTLVEHVIDTSSKLSPKITLIVASPINCSELSSALCNYKLGYSIQQKPLGTGDAVKSALLDLVGFQGKVLILAGDAPLISERSLRSAIELHDNSKATLTLISATITDPASYGRIIRDTVGVKEIKEAKDCSIDQLKIQEVNSGIYIVDSAFLAPALNKLSDKNAQSEYYLTDIVSIARSEGQNISCFTLNQQSEMLGVNTPYELHIVEKILKDNLIKSLLEQGVKILDPDSLLIENTVTIEPGCIIGPNVQLLGSTVISNGVTIEGTAWIKNSTIGENCILKLGVRIEDSKIGSDCTVGPFANLRAGTTLEQQVKIGNFVETKKSHFAADSKASHLSYIGDATVGAGANIGAGTITCNYDGYKKSETKIGAGAFIGSNTSLVAPVSIGAGATIGAGSTITKDIEADALALTRASLLTKAGWSKSKRK